MATTTGDSHGENKAEVERSSFNRDDVKLFLVTFAATVTANVVTLMVVVVAVILARHSTTPSQPATVPVLLILGCVIFAVMTVGIGVSAFRQKRPGKAIPRMIGLIVTVVAGVITVVFLLVLLG